MKNPVLYRKRIIPNECILLKDDIIVSCDDECIVTTWKALHPKPELHHGASAYFLKQGFKVSKFLAEDDSLLFWYCDIIDSEYNESDNSLVVTDLLADVIIYPDGFVKVVDLDELVDALNSGDITIDTLKKSISRLDSLLKIIYGGNFDTLKNMLP